MKKILSVIAAISMIATLAVSVSADKYPVAVRAEVDYENDIIRYYLEETIENEAYTVLAIIFSDRPDLIGSPYVGAKTAGDSVFAGVYNDREGYLVAGGVTGDDGKIEAGHYLFYQDLYGAVIDDIIFYTDETWPVYDKVRAPVRETYEEGVEYTAPPATNGGGPRSTGGDPRSTSGGVASPESADFAPASVESAVPDANVSTGVTMAIIPTAVALIAIIAALSIKKKK